MRTPNPFQTDPVWAKATENLSRIIQGNPVQEAQMESMLTDARSTQMQDRHTRENRQYANTAADAFGEGDLRRGFAQMIRTADPDMIEQAPSAVQAGGGLEMALGNLGPDQMRALISGAGGAGDLDQNTALTMGESNQISGRDAREDRALATAEARADALFPTTMEGLGVQRVRNGDAGFRNTNFDLAAGDQSVENILAEEAYLGLRDTEDAQRIVDPLSMDQGLYQQTQNGTVPMETAAGYRWGHTLDNNGGSGGGGGGSRSQEDIYGVLADKQALEGSLSDALSNTLVERGFPTNEDGNLSLENEQMSRFYATAQNEALQDQVERIRNGQDPLTADEAIQQALSEIPHGWQQPFVDNWGPWNTDRSGFAFGDEYEQSQQNQGSGDADNNAAQNVFPDSSPDTPVVLDPRGDPITVADFRETIKNNPNLTVEQIRRKIIESGGQPLGAPERGPSTSMAPGAGGTGMVIPEG